MDADANPQVTFSGGYLDVLVQTFGRAVVVRPRGEVDHHTMDPLREAFMMVRQRAPGLLVVDCHALEFCDSTGLNLLLRTRLAVAGAGGRMVLAAPPPIVARMLEITGAGDVFPVFAEVADALAADRTGDVSPG